jgi:hypothetical protein
MSFRSGQTVVETVDEASPRAAAGGVEGAAGLGKAQQLQLKRLLTRREYESLTRLFDTSRWPVRQQRETFLWDHRYFCVTRYTSPSQLAGLTLLEVQLRGDDEEHAAAAGDAGGGNADKFSLPPFLSIVREVTGEPAYSCHQLSMKR